MMDPKPCPICGGQVSLCGRTAGWWPRRRTYYVIRHDTYSVGRPCLLDFICLDERMTPESAIRMWNRICLKTE